MVDAMAGFFGLFDFTKEGPGVRKDEPDKGPVLGTLEILNAALLGTDQTQLHDDRVQFARPDPGLFSVSIYLLAALFPGWSGWQH
jgi:hypothetical protein